MLQAEIACDYYHCQHTREILQQQQHHYNTITGSGGRAWATLGQRTRPPDLHGTNRCD